VLVAAAAAVGARLRRLSIAHCSLASDAGLTQLAAACPNLRAVDVSHAFGVTPAGLIRFRALVCMRPRGGRQRGDGDQLWPRRHAQ
jgi:hypothetical protein